MSEVEAETERKAVIAWLLAQARAIGVMRSLRAEYESQALKLAADAIERGAHWPSTEGEGHEPDCPSEGSLLQRRHAIAIELLKEVQWVEDAERGPLCPVCYGEKPYEAWSSKGYAMKGGHTADCRLAAVLKEQL